MCRILRVLFLWVYNRHKHLHDETHTLPIKEHLKLHASQIRQNHNTPLHHNTINQHPDVRNKQHTTTQTLTQTPTS